MGVLRHNPMMKGASGMIGETIVFRQVNGKTVFSNRPEKRRKDSKRQKAQQAIFKRASRYATVQMKNHESKAAYKTGITAAKNNAYTVALTDFLNPPAVHYIKAYNYRGAVGDTMIKATDDFLVVRVSVVIIAGDGAVLEQGDAAKYPRKPNIWKYKTSVANPGTADTMIRATAFDKPNNTTSGALVIGKHTIPVFTIIGRPAART